MTLMTEIQNNQQLVELIRQIEYIPAFGDYDSDGILSPIINHNRWTQISEYIQKTFKNSEQFETFFKIYNPEIPSKLIKNIYDGSFANDS